MKSHQEDIIRTVRGTHINYINSWFNTFLACYPMSTVHFYFSTLLPLSRPAVTVLQDSESSRNGPLLESETSYRLCAPCSSPEPIYQQELCLQDDWSQTYEEMKCSTRPTRHPVREMSKTFKQSSELGCVIGREIEYPATQDTDDSRTKWDPGEIKVTITFKHGS